MNQLDDLQDAEAHSQAILRRQKQMVEVIREEIDNTHVKLRETLRLRDELYYRLFPPVRSDRDPKAIMACVEQMRAESTQLQDAITKQEAELQMLDAGFPSTNEASLLGEVFQRDSPCEVDNDNEERHALQDRIAQGRQNLTNLKISLAETKVNLDKTESLLSPIRLLPVEVLAEIFSYCKGAKFSISSPTPSPLSITHVCSSWRSIAINKADLWTCIRISTNDDHGKDGWPSLIPLWLERSKDLPLSFSISEDEKHIYELSADSVFFRILELFTPYSQRWKNVRLSNPAFAVPGVEWFSKFSSLGSFPLLESITLACLTMETTDIEKMMDMLEQSPLLHTIVWRVKSPPTTPTFPWAQLTTIDLLLIVSLGDLLLILAQSQRLTSADFHLHIEDSAVRGGFHHVTHPNLHTLHLGYAGELQFLLGFITLPKLTTFTIDELSALFILNAASAPWPQESFMSFLQRSKCCLRLFSLLDVKPSPADVLAILRHLSPSLVRFTVENENNQNVCVTDEVLRALTYPSSVPNPALIEYSEGMQIDQDEFTSVLCPSLQHIKLWGYMDTTDGVLADMVLSRWTPAIQSPRLAKLCSGEFGVYKHSRLPQDEARLANLHPYNILYATFGHD